LRASAAFEPVPDQGAVLAWLDFRYGLTADTFAGHRFWHRPGTPSIWIAAADCAPPPGLRLEAFGLLMSREPLPRAKPTSVFLQRFAATATRNVFDLDVEAAGRFLRGETQPLPAGSEGKGFCVVRAAGRVLGCGQATEGMLVSLLPRAWVEMLTCA
jgi:hypothetical protein